VREIKRSKDKMLIQLTCRKSKNVLIIEMFCRQPRERSQFREPNIQQSTTLPSF